MRYWAWALCLVLSDPARRGLSIWRSIVSKLNVYIYGSFHFIAMAASPMQPVCCQPKNLSRSAARRWDCSIGQTDIAFHGRSRCTKTHNANEMEKEEGLHCDHVHVQIRGVRLAIRPLVVGSLATQPGLTMA